MFAYCNNNPTNSADPSGASMIRPNVMMTDAGHTDWGREPNPNDPADTTHLVHGQGVGPIANVSFAGSTVGESGCGAIATHDCIILSGRSSNFRDVINYFCSSLRTRFFGVAPKEMAGYLYYLEIPYYQLNCVEDVIKYADRGVIIVTFWNKPPIASFCGISIPNVTEGAHTVAIKYCGGVYCVYNAYDKDRNCRKMSAEQLIKYIGGGYIDAVCVEYK